MHNCRACFSLPSKHTSGLLAGYGWKRLLFPFLSQMKTMSSCQKALKTYVSLSGGKKPPNLNKRFLAVFTYCKNTHSEGILGVVGLFSSYIK